MVKRRRKATIETNRKDSNNIVTEASSSKYNNLSSSAGGLILDADQEYEISKTFTGKFFKGKTSLDPTTLLTTVADQEGDNQRMGSRKLRALDQNVFTTHSADFGKKTPEERFDVFIAEHCQKRGQYFAIANMFYVLYGIFVFARCTFFAGAHNYAFITVESVEPRMNRMIWTVRVTCIMLAISVLTLRAYLTHGEEVRQGIIFDKGEISKRQKEQWENREGVKFFYAVIQMTVFLLATCAFLYAHSVQFITHLDKRNSQSLYGLLLYNMDTDYLFEWDAGPKPKKAMLDKDVYVRYSGRIDRFTIEDVPYGIPKVDNCVQYQKTITSLGANSMEYGKSGYMDVAQYELKCCGLNSPEDWLFTNWYKQKTNEKHLEKAQSGSNGIESSGMMNARKTPLSCCQQINGPTSLNYEAEQLLFKTAQEFLNLIQQPCLRQSMFTLFENLNSALEYNCTPYPIGCYPLIEDIYDSYSLEFLIHSGLMMFVSLLMVVVSQMFVVNPKSSIMDPPPPSTINQHNFATSPIFY